MSVATGGNDAQKLESSALKAYAGIAGSIYEYTFQPRGQWTIGEFQSTRKEHNTS